MQNKDEEKPENLRSRTKRFALRVIRLSAATPSTVEGFVIRKQFVRCGTSVGAQYREACRARSRAEFVSKMESALQELNETVYWIEVLIESKLVAESRLISIYAEANELLAIFVSSIQTSKRHS